MSNLSIKYIGTQVVKRDKANKFCHYAEAGVQLMINNTLYVLEFHNCQSYIRATGEINTDFDLNGECGGLTGALVYLNNNHWQNCVEFLANYVPDVKDAEDVKDILDFLDECWPDADLAEADEDEE